MFSRHTIQILNRKRTNDIFHYRDSHVWIYNGKRYFVFHVHPRDPDFDSVGCHQYPDVNQFKKDHPYITLCGFLTSSTLSSSDLTALLIRNAHEEEAPTVDYIDYRKDGYMSSEIPVHRLSYTNQKEDKKSRKRTRRPRTRKYVKVKNFPWYFHY